MKQSRWLWLSLGVAIAGCIPSMDHDYIEEPWDERPRNPLPPSKGAPVSGGTILVTADGEHAVIADPDRDRVMVVTLATKSAAQIALQAGDEPGRLVEDGDGRVHIALRRGGALVTLSPELTNVVERRPVCGEPRGVAWEAERDVVHVACAGGELVTFKAAGGPALRTLRLDRDLRDVVVNRDKLIVSRFRSAELLYIDPKGNVVARKTSPVTARTVPTDPFPTPQPGVRRDAFGAVAYRSVLLSDGGILMLHQRAVDTPLLGRPGGYGGGGGGGGFDPLCSNTCCFRGLNEAALTVIRPDLPAVAVRGVFDGALPVDVAINEQTKQVAAVLAGPRQVQVVSTDVLARVDDPACVNFTPVPSEVTILGDDPTNAMPTSVAWTPSGALLIYYPDSPSLAVRTGSQFQQVTTIALPGKRSTDAGRDFFHRETPSGLACASCHPEAREDGRIWNINNMNVRTQSLAGSLLARKPYHWVGDMFDLQFLLQDVFTMRMSGGPVFGNDAAALGQWLESIPSAKASAPLDAAAVARGKELFASPMVGCDACHGGPIFTRNQRFDVGTGGFFKAPSLLGVAARAPFMHNGCAPTLRDRFGMCGGGDRHGMTSQLTSAQIDDLVAFLETL